MNAPWTRPVPGRGPGRDLRGGHDPADAGGRDPGQHGHLVPVYPGERGDRPDHAGDLPFHGLWKSDSHVVSARTCW